MPVACSMFLSPGPSERVHHRQNTSYTACKSYNFNKKLHIVTPVNANSIGTIKTVPTIVQPN